MEGRIYFNRFVYRESALASSNAPRVSNALWKSMKCKFSNESCYTLKMVDGIEILAKSCLFYRLVGIELMNQPISNNLVLYFEIISLLESSSSMVLELSPFVNIRLKVHVQNLYFHEIWNILSNAFSFLHYWNKSSSKIGVTYKIPQTKRSASHKDNSPSSAFLIATTSICTSTF